MYIYIYVLLAMAQALLLVDYPSQLVNYSEVHYPSITPNILLAMVLYSLVELNRYGARPPRRRRSSPLAG